MSWKRLGEGNYEFEDGDYYALVWLEGEFWRNAVYFQGGIRDLGEWPGRDHAFRNTHGALRRLRANRGLPSVPEEDDDD